MVSIIHWLEISGSFVPPQVFFNSIDHVTCCHDIAVEWGVALGTEQSCLFVRLIVLILPVRLSTQFIGYSTSSPVVPSSCCGTSINHLFINELDIPINKHFGFLLATH